MSSYFQHKIYDYEVAPPPGVWEKITGELDDSQLTDKFPATIYNAESLPPATSWSVIASSLQELNLTTRFPETLYNLQATPPATAWDKIRESLGDNIETTVPKRKKIIPFVRYAAAAAIVGAIAFGAIRILDSNELTGVANTQDNIPASDPGVALTNPAKNNVSALPDTNTQTDDDRDNAALEESKHTYASLGTSTKHRLKKVSAEFFETPANPISAVSQINPANTYQDLECSEVNAPAFANGSSSIEMAGRYVMLMTPDGRVIRISKKLGDLVCCVSGEELDDDCKDQLDRWRQKIAESPVAPSPSNFMGIFDLLQTLKEHKL